ncbi:AfsR/SARP family transcriptional regulator [Streptomyces tauricus]|uniref:AfsR/SARP family transcriptional regulator n=1 Tax=Streptomyces tauricus TaxID=68274 RepID=UPI00380DEE24
MDGDARLRITLLGALQASVSRGDGAALPVPGARLQALLVRLALAGGRAVAQGVLVDAIWAEDPPAGPAHALQALVSRLRRTLGSAALVTQLAGGYLLDVAAADVDALRFEQLAAAGRDRLRAGDPRGAATVLGEALALWGDRAGTEPAVVATVAPAAATRLAHVSVEAVADLAEAELTLHPGDHADTAAARLTALLADHPLHERAAALLMDALAAQGRRAEALALYERVRRTLADDLGTDPGTALRERHLRLLRPERSPRPERSGRPEQSAPGADAVRTGPGNLPAPWTSFIGRDDDLARIETLLAAGRLVTVVGPGGAGKTRLAVEAARRHRHAYRDGAWLADLAPVTEPAKVGAALLAAIGSRGGTVFEAGNRGEGDDLDVLVERLRGRESLLLVDNCEHLIEPVAHLVAALLSRCSGLRVLATGREPLAVDGEALVPLGPLALPGPHDDVGQARRAASVRLFAERAAAVRPGFEVDGTTLAEVRQVVRGLDGMPLALELAAARLRTLSLPELADGLSDRFALLGTGSRSALPRHRTLRAVIAWSWDLLSGHERTVADRVSVLPGGVTVASATALCAGTAVPPAEIPALLAALVDRSLLHLAPQPPTPTPTGPGADAPAFAPVSPGLGAGDAPAFAPVSPGLGGGDASAFAPASPGLGGGGAPAFAPALPGPGGGSPSAGPADGPSPSATGTSGYPPSADGRAPSSSGRAPSTSGGTRSADDRTPSGSGRASSGSDGLPAGSGRAAADPGRPPASFGRASSTSGWGDSLSARRVPLFGGSAVSGVAVPVPVPGRYRMLETLREYGTGRLVEADELGAVRDLAADHFADLLARCEPLLRGPGQTAAVRIIRAEYDNTLAALRRRCDKGDADGAVSLALNLTWYWQMLGLHSDAAYWLGEALAVPGGGATPDRDCARAIHLLNRIGTRPGASAEPAADDRARIREVADRLLAYPELPGPYGALAALPLAFLRGEGAVPAIVGRLADGDDVWLAGMARMFRAQFAENAGLLDEVRPEVEAALACFRQVGDRWGLADALPMRALLRQYDDDLDGALADLREARSLAGEFGPLSLGDEVFGDLRWIDLHLRRGDTDVVSATIDSARERALRANSPETRFLVDAWEAVLRVRLGDLDRARDLLDGAERGLYADPPPSAGARAFPGDHARALVGSARAALCLQTGDTAGARQALVRAYAAALETGDLPNLSLVAVTVAALAEARGCPREAAVLLGAAARLRGAHDRTDRQVRDLTRRGRAALGAAAFAAAYEQGWDLDARTATTVVDPARLPG